EEVYRVGGAQAIAAMAFGTETIPRVDRIVGPGNAYVAEAKKLLSGDVGIDFVAGPTEILILAAEGDANIIAADMPAQAEHDVALLPQIRNAGTVFLGQNSPESAGDYAAGPSHVLPTGGAARLRGGLSSADFVKLIAIQELSPSALAELVPTITTLARVEGLE